MTVIVDFEAVGVPAPQGSHRAFIAGGKARMRDMGGKAGANWRDAVATSAKAIADGNPSWAPLDGPLGLTVVFRFPMPQSRSKAVRALGCVFKTTAPDTSKLVRALEDGIQAGGLVVDDARFCVVKASKVETTGWTGASIAITRETTP